MLKSAWKNLGVFFRLPYLPLWLAPFLLLSPVLLTGKGLFWGTPGLQFVPWWQWAWQTLLSGHLPLWNPLVGMGAPLLANYQSALFYPPNWAYFGLAALGGPPALAWGQALLVVLHLAWAGFGTAKLVQKLGLGVLPQAVAGLAYGLSGYLVARAGFLSINSAAAWLPWLLFLSKDFGRGKVHKRIVILLAITAGIQLLAGHAQTTAYSLLMTLAWAGFWAWLSETSTDNGRGKHHGEEREAWTDKARRTLVSWAWTAAALTGGFALAAVQLLPTAEYLIQSQRAAAIDYEFAMTFSFWPWRLLSFIAPDLFGSPVQGDYWGYGAYWEDAVYIGLLPFVLAMGVLLASIRTRIRGTRPFPAEGWSGRPLIVALLVWLGVTLLLALGQNTPIYPWLYLHIPGFDMFQAPARFMLWAEISLAILAAYGVARWRRPTGRALYWTRLATAGAVAVTIGAGLTWAFLGDVRPTFIRATALAGFWGVGIGLLSLTAPFPTGEPRQPAWSWIVIGFLTLDLLVAGWGLNPGVSLDFFRGTAPDADQVAAQIGEGRLYLGADEEYDLKFNRFLQFSSFFSGEDWINLRATLLPNIHLLDGIRHTANFDPLVPGRYAEWLAAMEGSSPAAKERLLNLGAVTLVEITDSDAPFGVRFESRNGGRRYYWVPCARHVDDPDEGWRELIVGKVNIESEVLLEGLGKGQNGSCEKVGTSDIKAVDETPNSIILEVEASQQGWLVVADIWYPGWTAKIDGVETTVLRANYLFRAVQMPAGIHRVEFTYRPLWFYLGLLVTSLSGIGLGVAYAGSRQ
jgi:hypothetical protein